MSGKKYQNFGDDANIEEQEEQHSHEQPSISDGPTLNSIPHAKVVPGLLCGIFKKPRWCQDGFKVLIVIAVVFSTIIGLTLIIDISLRKTHKPLQVVTDHPECTSLVRELMDTTDSNAVDGAVAGMFCLAITRPDLTSLASGGFMIYHSEDKSSGLDFQMEAPGDKTIISPVALPGLVEGLLKTHQLHGSTKLARLLESCITLAKNGFKVYKKTVEGEFGFFEKNMQIMLSKHGNGIVPLQEGDILRLPEVSKLLYQISRGNLKPYQDDIIEKVKDLGWTSEMFKSYQSKELALLKTSLKNGVTLLTLPPPSSGIVSLLATKYLDYLLPETSTPLDKYFTIAETLKSTFENQSRLLDEPSNLHEKIAELLQKDDIDGVVKSIKSTVDNKIPRQTATGKTPAHPKLDVKSANVLVIDHNNQVAAISSSLGHSFGNKQMTKSGVVLNNGMKLFPSSWKISESNRRPPSSAALCIAVKKGQDSEESEDWRAVFGSNGGLKGLAALTQVMTDVFVSGMDVSKSTLDKARLFYDIISGDLYYEGSKGSSGKIQKQASELSKYFGPAVKEMSEPLGYVSMASKGERKGKSLVDPRSN
ncbi:glutathione hydrolase 7-like [Clytia hemisphaerica]|uniref:Uncharacterized protein n=1 Tax=Clytia hemisphaerica TaxID=252671 RepID=A0A7M5V4X3_9CNID